MEYLKKILLEKEKESLLRKLKPLSNRLNGKVWFQGREYADFSSNDYLGLSQHPEIKKESQKVIDSLGTSSSASRLMSGDLFLHHQLEEEIARLKNKEAGLVFSSGYQANLGIISSLYNRDDCIFSDRLNHASIIDGIRLSRAKLFRFQHNNSHHLESLLVKERKKFRRALIVTETIFSMEGDRSPLKEIIELKHKYDCQVMVDEAHATGLFGRNGSGIVEEDGVEADIDYILGTFSKALGGFGAYFAASKLVIDYLINTARSFIYTTALPPAVVAGNLASLDIIKKEPFRRKKVLELSHFFSEQLKHEGFDVRGASPIIPVVIGDSAQTLLQSEKLKEKGYWILAVRPPTVPPKEARLRFSITYYHNQDILERLIHDLKNIRV